MRPTCMRLLLLAPLVVLAAACGSPDGTTAGGLQPTSAPGSLAGDSSPTSNDLLVEVRAAPDAPVQRYTLVCAGVVEGDHPEPEAACEHLLAREQPFAPLGTDLFCTQQYGGPQTAHVTGRWRGQPVDLQLSRVDGCHIGQWDGLGPLLPGLVG